MRTSSLAWIVFVAAVFAAITGLGSVLAVIGAIFILLLIHDAWYPSTADIVLVEICEEHQEVSLRDRETGRPFIECDKCVTETEGEGSESDGWDDYEADLDEEDIYTGGSGGDGE